jgi:endoglucanase
MTATTDRHQQWLTELTELPTVAGHEDRVVEWIERWAARRKDVRMDRDRAGNVTLRSSVRTRKQPVVLTAHIDHPGFVVTSVDRSRRVGVEFRGGVHGPYFDDARVDLFDAGDGVHRGTLVDFDHKTSTGAVRLDRRASALAPGDIGRWAFSKRSLGDRDGTLYAPGCDDLAGAAAVLSAFDVIRKSAPQVRVLLTRAEEVGFIGAIAACKLGTIPDNASLIVVENSRAFRRYPVGSGPVVRVGDASTVFDQHLTNRVTRLVRTYVESHEGVLWQRRLMDGGSCEATAFGAYGYRATSLSLALGNYHNMVDIDGVLAGGRPARVGPEYVSLGDFHTLVELLSEVAPKLVAAEDAGLRSRLDDLYDDERAVLT